MTAPPRPQAGVLARWRGLSSRPGEFAAFCGAPGCRERLGRAWLDDDERDEPFSWVPDPGYVSAAGGYLRFSTQYRDHHPRRTRWRRDSIDLGPVRRGVLRGDPFSPMRGPTRTVGRKSAFEHRGVRYIVCRSPKCGAHNLLVPHLGVQTLPARKMLKARCGLCPRCLAAGQECGWDGRCPDCLAPLGGAFVPSLPNT